MQELAFIVGRLFDKLSRDHKLVAMEAVFYDKDTASALARLAKEPKNPKAQLDFATQMMSIGVRAEVAGQDGAAPAEKPKPVSSLDRISGTIVPNPRPDRGPYAHAVGVRN